MNTDLSHSKGVTLCRRILSGNPGWWNIILKFTQITLDDANLDQIWNIYVVPNTVTDLDVSMVSEDRWHSWYALVWMGPSATVDIRSISGYMFHALSSTQAWITTEIDRNIPTRFESKQGPVHCALASSSQAGFLPHTYLGVSENRQISGNASGFSGVRKKGREDLHRASQNPAGKVTMWPQLWRQWLVIHWG